MPKRLSQQSRSFCLTVMPFAPRFAEVYEKGIKRACSELGIACERIDEQVFEERILDRIHAQIEAADVVVADVTGKSANVFYEVGYSHALNKPTVLVAGSARSVPFNIKDFPVIIYGQDIRRLQTELSTRLNLLINGQDASLVFCARH